MNNYWFYILLYKHTDYSLSIKLTKSCVWNSFVAFHTFLNFGIVIIYFWHDFPIFAKVLYWWFFSYYLYSMLSINNIIVTTLLVHWQAWIAQHKFWHFILAFIILPYNRNSPSNIIFLVIKTEIAVKIRAPLYYAVRIWMKAAS